jgi:folate-dependent phosphoribosylglycinamide formyltransferase PurN
MRVVILISSVYSETACALAVRLAQAGHVPVGALALRTLDRKTLARKVVQLGVRNTAAYARSKLISRSERLSSAQNTYLRPWLTTPDKTFRSLREVASLYGFPLVTCRDQNARTSIAQLKAWSPDVIVFAGGNILRQPLLQVPRLGVLNAHLGLLPEIRGMSAPEWSLLTHVPVGVTIHYIDAGIDTGPILQRCELPDAPKYNSLSDLRNRLVAFGVEEIAGVICDLARGRPISPKPQAELNVDHQHFVIHEWLRAKATQQLANVNVESVGPAVARLSG